MNDSWELYTSDTKMFLCLRYSKEAAIAAAEEFQNRWPFLELVKHEPKAEMARILGMHGRPLSLLTDELKRS